MNPEDDLFESILRAASVHAAVSEEPDHEVGDLQDLARVLWGLLTPAQRRRALKHEAVRNIFDCASLEVPS